MPLCSRPACPTICRCSKTLRAPVAFLLSAKSSWLSIFCRGLSSELPDRTARPLLPLSPAMCSSSAASRARSAAISEPRSPRWCLLPLRSSGTYLSFRASNSNRLWISTLRSLPASTSLPIIWTAITPSRSTPTQRPIVRYAAGGRFGGAQLRRSDVPGIRFAYEGARRLVQLDTKNSGGHFVERRFDRLQWPHFHDAVRKLSCAGCTTWKT